MDARVKKLLPEGMLERLASPERLDEMMVVVPPKGWWAFATCGFVVGAALLWAFFGWIPIKVQGQGLLVRGGGVDQVTSDTTGQIAKILAGVGQVVHRGDVVARVNRPDLLIHRRSLHDEHEAFSLQHKDFLSRSQEHVVELRRQIRKSKERLRKLGPLAEKGSIPKFRLEEIRQELARDEKEISREMDARAERENRIREVAREIQELDGQLANGIETRHAGKVLELKVNLGDSVSPGTPILTLEPLAGEIQAVLYVPAAHGKKILPDRGQEVRVSPSNYRVEEYGYILADIVRVSEYPVSPEATENVLRNAHLADALTGEGTFFEVVVSLRRADTPSGFEWSSGKGPEGDVYTGTLCTASIVVEWRRPITWLLDFLDKLTG